MYDESIDEKNFADKEKITPSGITNSFDTGIAKACGIEAAIIYNHICYWVQQNIIHEKNQYDGRTWTYMTYEQMIFAIPYLTIKQVRLGVSKLLEAGLIVKGDYSQDRFVKPTYYAVVNESALVDSKKSYESAKRADRSAQLESSRCPKGQLEAPKRAALLIGTDSKYTDNNNNTHPNPQSGESAKADEKVNNEKLTPRQKGTNPRSKGTNPRALGTNPRDRIFTEFGSHVKLTIEEHKALCETYGESLVATIIEEMNDWCLANGRNYKDYAAAIRQWFRKREDITQKAKKDRKFAPSSDTSRAIANMDRMKENAL